VRFELHGSQLAALLLIAVLHTGCGASGDDEDAARSADAEPPASGLGGIRREDDAKPRPSAPEASPELGFPASATKNTTRVGGSDPVANAAAVARVVFPSRSRETRPAAVTLVERSDWRTAISAAQLMSRPIRAPVLFSQGGALPAATVTALKALAPIGAKELDGAQAIGLGDTAAPPGLKLRRLSGSDYAARARTIDRLHAAAAGKPSRAVLIAPAGDPEIAMPAAGWAAKAGSPVLWVRGAAIPAATIEAIRDHGRPRIYLLGPESAIPRTVSRRLARFGTVRRISGSDAVTTAVAFARYADGGFGWNAVDPGHGFVFARATQPLAAVAAAPLSASGTYGPLLLLSDDQRLDQPVRDYLLDVQPGYDSDPVRGVYNHGWLVGDVGSISIDVQSRIDALLEIQPVNPDHTAP